MTNTAGKHRKTFKLGTGSARMELESFQGDIELRRPQEMRERIEEHKHDHDNDNDNDHDRDRDTSFSLHFDAGTWNYAARYAKAYAPKYAKEYAPRYARTYARMYARTYKQSYRRTDTTSH